MAETEAGPAAAPVPEPPVVAATWQEREPDDAWCPEALRPAVPWAADVDGAHLRTWEDRDDATWHLLAGTRRGRSHAHQAQWREDAALTARLETSAGRVTLLVAADGAGSARWSRVGAEAACRAVRDAMAPALGDPRAATAVPDGVRRAPVSEASSGTSPAAALAEAAAYACDALRTIARAGGGEPRDVRTTLLAAVLWGDGTDARLAVTQVGDGAILVRTHDGGVQQLGAGDAGDYSGEVTCFVPDDEAPARARAALVERAAHDVTHVLLLTDGIEDPFYPLARRGGTLFAQLLAGVESPAEHFQRQAVHGPVFGDAAACARLGAWLAFERRGENDDRTIVAAIRVGAR